MNMESNQQSLQDAGFVEVEPGVFFSTPPYRVTSIPVSEEFKRYAELSKVSTRPLQYLAVAMRQIVEDLSESLFQ